MRPTQLGAVPRVAKGSYHGLGGKGVVAQNEDQVRTRGVATESAGRLSTSDDLSRGRNVKILQEQVGDFFLCSVSATCDSDKG
jgi:hypothetical protein